MTAISKDKSYALALARRMHPDLDWPKPAPEVEDRLNRMRLSDQLTDLQRVYENPDIDMPGYGGIGVTIYCSVHDYSQHKDDGNYLDEEASRKKIARNTRALKAMGAKIEKHYADTSFSVTATFDSGLVIKCYVERAAVCEKKVVGTKWVEPTKGYMQEIVEWDCEPVSLMGMEV